MKYIHNRSEARKYLRSLGIAQNFFHMFHWILPSCIIALAAVVGVGGALMIFFATCPHNPAAFSMLGGTIAAAALILGYTQWRLMRFEMSLDRYYDRLSSLNARLIEWEEARALMSDDDGAASLGVDLGRARQKMYIFQELDALEYFIQKFSLGLVQPELLARAVLQFEHRCRWSNFRRLLSTTILGRSDYSPKLLALVNRIAAERNELPGSLSLYERAVKSRDSE